MTRGGAGAGGNLKREKLFGFENNPIKIDYYDIYVQTIIN